VKFSEPAIGGFDARFLESLGWLGVLILPPLFQGRR
jgi:hypothetical protein